VSLVQNQFPAIRLIRNSENLGFAKANNRGIREAQGNYILLLNSDTVVRRGALQAMADFLDEHSKAGAVTCRLLNADGSIQACVSRRPNPMLLFFRLSGLSRLCRSDAMRRLVRKYLGTIIGATLRGYFDPYTTNSSIEVENISGACLMLRREAVSQVGFLDENFFMYFEDMDYCLRLRAAGWKLYYLPSGEIVHLVGQSSGGRMREYSVQSHRSLFYFYRKHYSVGSRGVVRLLVLLGSGFRWTYNAFRSQLKDSAIYRQNKDALIEVIRTCFE